MLSLTTLSVTTLSLTTHSMTLDESYIDHNITLSAALLSVVYANVAINFSWLISVKLIDVMLSSRGAS